MSGLFPMLMFRCGMDATYAICKCGARSAAQDWAYRWRCPRGHFCSPNKGWLK